MSAAGPAIEPIGEGDFDELRDLYRTLGLYMPEENFQQFARPRAEPSGHEIVTLGLREGGRLVGTIGWLGAPLLLSGGERSRARWMINFYMLPELRGRGLGQRLHDAARGAGCCSLLYGGTAQSIRLFEKSGWRLVGQIECWRWLSPALSPARIPERIGRGARARPPARIDLRHGRGEGSRVTAAAGSEALAAAPWAEGRLDSGAVECGVPRTLDYLRFAFEGAMSRYFVTYAVSVDDRIAGFFTLALRAIRRPLLGSDLIDFDAIPGREAQVLAAAKRCALAVSDLVRIRVTPSPRFVAALRALGARKVAGGEAPLRILRVDGPRPEILDASLWRVTPGDHDQYRARPGSQAWGGAPRSVPPQRR